MADTGSDMNRKTLPHCHFLGLPREIRDIIYEYALSEPEGLFFRPERTAFEVEHDVFTAFATLEAANDQDAVEANQLKYVCHQLRDETAGLGVKVNDLTFNVKSTCKRHSTSGYTRCNSVCILEGFLKTCSPKRLTQILKISCAVQDIKRKDSRLRDDVVLRAALSNVITRFLFDYPQATFNWYLGACYTTPNGLYNFYFVYRMRLKFGDPEDDSPLFAGLEPYNLKRKYPENFVIWPPRSLQPDESAFRSMIANTPHEIDACKEWIEHGIRTRKRRVT